MSEYRLVDIKGRISIGRGNSNDIVVSDNQVSSLHAFIEKNNNKYFVVDNSSTNGTFVNGKKINKQELKQGDLIKIGNETIKVDHNVLILSSNMKSASLIQAQVQQNSAPQKPIFKLLKATTVGRDATCNFVVKDETVSRHHATITKQNGQYILTDNNSLAGTLVNGQKISSCALQDGAKITLGKTTFYYRQGALYQHPPVNVEKDKSSNILSFVSSFRGKVIAAAVIAVLLVFGLVAAALAINANHNTSHDDSLAGAVNSFKDPESSLLQQTARYGLVPINYASIMMEENADRKLAEKAAGKIGGQIVGEMQYINKYQIEFNNNSEQGLIGAIDTLSKQKGVAIASPLLIGRIRAEGTSCQVAKGESYKKKHDEDDSTNLGTPYEQVKMESAWQIIKGSGVKLNNVKVGLTDTGISTCSNDFNGKVKVRGITVGPQKNKKGEIEDGGLTHATMVANIIAANYENGGFAGIASPLEDKLEVEVLNSCGKNLGSGYVETTSLDDTDTLQKFDGEDGKYYLDRHMRDLLNLIKSGSTVINVSMGRDTIGYDEMVPVYKRFVEKIANDYPNVVFVVAAGNGKKDPETNQYIGEANDGNNDYLAGYSNDNIITVGAVNIKGEKAEFSNYATGDGEVTVSAVGENLYVGDATMGEDEQGNIISKKSEPIIQDGTSLAAPQVTAAVAILQSINPKLTAREIKQIIKNTSSVNVGSTNIPENIGGGVLNIEQAVLTTINQVRVKNKQKTLKLEQALSFGKISLTVNSDNEIDFENSDMTGNEITVTAGIIGSEDGEAVPVKIVVQGNHKMSDAEVKNVSPGGNASWKIKLESSAAKVIVYRLDTNACAYYTFCDFPTEKLDITEFPIDGKPNEEITIRANIVNDSYKYAWDMGDGSKPIIQKGLDTIIHKFKKPGDYDVLLMLYTESEMFIDIATVRVKIKGDELRIDGPERASVGEKVVFYANLYHADYNYLWTPGDDVAVYEKGLDRFVHTFTEAGTYTVILGRDKDGEFVDSASTTIEIVEPEPTQTPTQEPEPTPTPEPTQTPEQNETESAAYKEYIKKLEHVQSQVDNRDEMTYYLDYGECGPILGHKAYYVHYGLFSIGYEAYTSCVFVDLGPDDYGYGEAKWNSEAGGADNTMQEAMEEAKKDIQ